MTNHDEHAISAETLRARLNAETATIAWKELQPFFARGSVIRVADGLDLVAVAAAVVEDDRDAVEAWLLQRQIERVEAQQARYWYDSDARLWAVVAAPWVLVQERGLNAGRGDAGA